MTGLFHSFSYWVSVAGSIFLHVLVIVLMFSNWQKIEQRELPSQPRVVQATLVELEAREPKRTEVIDLTARRQAEQEAARRAAEIAREKELARLEEQRKKEEAERRERERKAELERQREMEQQRIQQEQLVAQQRADDFQRALEAEENYQAAQAEQQIVDSIGYQIERAVEVNWSRPPSARRGMETVLRVSLVPTGGLSSVEIVASSGDDAFDRSAMQAVQKAAPFDVLKQLEPSLFERNFRTFQFRFSPQDLRL